MVKINDKIYLDADSNCYMIKIQIAEDTEENRAKKVQLYDNYGYYVSLESAIKGLITYFTREYLSKKDKNTLNDLLEEIKRIREHIENLDLDL